jgi:hypothetical protein
MFNLTKREAPPEEAPPDYQEWDVESLLSVKPFCVCGEPGRIPIVDPETNTFETYCAAHYQALCGA